MLSLRAVSRRLLGARAFSTAGQGVASLEEQRAVIKVEGANLQDYLQASAALRAELSLLQRSHTRGCLQSRPADAADYCAGGAAALLRRGRRRRRLLIACHQCQAMSGPPSEEMLS